MATLTVTKASTGKGKRAAAWTLDRKWFDIMPPFSSGKHLTGK